MTERSFNVAVNEEITPSVQEVFNHSGAIHKTLGVFTNNTESDAEYPLDITFAANRQALDLLMVLPNKKNSASFNLYVQFYKNSGATSYPLLAPGDVEVFMSNAAAGEVKTSSISYEIAIAVAPMTDTIRIHGNVPVAAGGEVTLIAAFLPVTEMISAGSGYTLNAILETINQIAESVAIQEPYRLLEVDNNGMLCNNTTTKKKIDISGATSLQAMVLAYAYANNEEIEGTVDFSSVTSLQNERSLFRAFSGCTGITSVDFSSLTSVSGTSILQNTFSGCTALKYLDFPELVSITGIAPMGQLAANSGVEVVRFPKLATITASNSFSQAFQNCISLTDVYFNALKTTSFGATTNQFSNMFSGDTDVKLHFPSNLTATIAGLDTYPNFGGTNTQVLFDLPATE